MTSKNGIYLKPNTYTKLFDCYQEDFPISSQDEVIADWISASSLGAKLRATPSPADRKSLATRAMEGLCFLLDDPRTKASPNSHPLGIQRLKYIYFRDPDIRAALGLAPLPYCTLQGRAAH